MSGFFQRLFGKDNKPAIARGPLGLHLNSGFTLDTLSFRLLEDELLNALPGVEFTGAAVSHIDLGGGSQIFRYYTSGDEFLQINTTGGEDIDDIDDIKLFVYDAGNSRKSKPCLMGGPLFYHGLPTASYRSYLRIFAAKW